MIKTFKANGIGTIADVVINHHNTNGWFGFPAETYKGMTYQFKSTDITANDDGGAAKTEAGKEGAKLSSNNDEGEDWSGMRDLDHKSQNVQTMVKANDGNNTQLNGAWPGKVVTATVKANGDTWYYQSFDITSFLPYLPFSQASCMLLRKSTWVAQHLLYCEICLF